MMESLEMSESSKTVAEESLSSPSHSSSSPPPLRMNPITIEEELQEVVVTATTTPSSPPRRKLSTSSETHKSSSPYKTALNKIEKFLATPSRRIGNNSVEPAALLVVPEKRNSKEPPLMDYPVLTSSPFHLKRKDLLLPDPSSSSGNNNNNNSQQHRHNPHLQTPSGTSVGGDFASQDDDQVRLTTGGRSSNFSPPRLPCGLTNFHLSLFFGMIGFILFWLVLLLRIYLPVNYFGTHSTGKLHRNHANGSIILNDSLITATAACNTTSSSSSSSEPLSNLSVSSTSTSSTLALAHTTYSSTSSSSSSSSSNSSSSGTRGETRFIDDITRKTTSTFTTNATSSPMVVETSSLSPSTIETSSMMMTLNSSSSMPRNTTLAPGAS